MKEVMIMNTVSVVAGSLVIGIGCIVSHSAWPLFGFVLVPRWTYNENHETKDGGKEKK